MGLPILAGIKILFCSNIVEHETTRCRSRSRWRLCKTRYGKHAGCGKRKEFKFTHKLLSLNSDINLLIL